MNINFIRDNTDLARENQVKRFLDPNLVDDILKIDEQYRKILSDNSTLRMIKNRVTKSFNKVVKSQNIRDNFRQELEDGIWINIDVNYENYLLDNPINEFFRTMFDVEEIYDVVAEES